MPCACHFTALTWTQEMSGAKSPRQMPSRRGYGDCLEWPAGLARTAADTTKRHQERRDEREDAEPIVPPPSWHAAAPAPFSTETTLRDPDAPPSSSQAGPLPHYRLRGANAGDGLTARAASRKHGTRVPSRPLRTLAGPACIPQTNAADNAWGLAGHEAGREALVEVFRILYEAGHKALRVASKPPRFRQGLMLLDEERHTAVRPGNISDNSLRQDRAQGIMEAAWSTSRTDEKKSRMGDIRRGLAGGYIFANPYSHIAGLLTF